MMQPDSDLAEKIGVIPLKAFFVGLLLVIIAIAVNSIYPYQGGWRSFSRAVVLVLILAMSGIYCLCFMFISLYLWIGNLQIPNVNILPAQYAAGLHGIYVVLVSLVLLFA